MYTPSETFFVSYGGDCCAPVTAACISTRMSVASVNACRIVHLPRVVASSANLSTMRPSIARRRPSPDRRPTNPIAPSAQWLRARELATTPRVRWTAQILLHLAIALLGASSSLTTVARLAYTTRAKPAPHFACGNAALDNNAGVEVSRAHGHLARGAWAGRPRCCRSGPARLPDATTSEVHADVHTRLQR